MERLLHTCLLASAALALGADGTCQGFVDVTPGSGLEGVAPAFLPLGSGVSVGDFDGDGDMDVLSGNNPSLPLLLFENQGNLQFVDRSATSGLGPAELVRGIYAADVDDDGDQDAVVRRRHDPTQLFLNDGSAHFTDEAAARGVVDALTVDGFAACFGDYDLDGSLDLYLGNRDALEVTCCPPNQLFRNDGTATFTDVSFQAGVAHAGLTLVASFLDFDQDGWPDLHCSNDKGTTFLPNALFRNRGDGTFEDVSVATNTAQAVDGMGLDFLDLFNDGGVDFFVSDAPDDHLLQVWDPLTHAYGVDQATYGGFGGPGLTGWAVHFLDVENDGWQDLHVVHSTGPNHLYANPGSPAAALAPWSEVGASLGLDLSFGQRVAVTADFDDDGRVDLLERFELGGPTPAARGLTLLRNEVPGGHWLKLAVEGTTSNRDGIGTRIRVAAQGLVQDQAVRNGTGYLGGSDPRVHFGLGAATSCNVELTWPSGLRHALYGVAADRVLRVVEPEFVAPAVVAPGGTATLELRAEVAAGQGYATVLSLTPAPGTPLGGGRALPLALDGLSFAAFAPANGLVSSPLGLVAPDGTASSTLAVPPLPALAGLTVFATAVTFDAQGRWGVVFPRAAALEVQ